MVPQLASAAVGIWLMAAPAVLGYGAPVATLDHVIGPLVVSFGLVAAWAVTRALRWVNVGLSAILVAAHLLLGPEPAGIATGLLIGALSLVRGRTRHPYAGGWRGLVSGR